MDDTTVDQIKRTARYRAVDILIEHGGDEECTLDEMIGDAEVLAMYLAHGKVPVPKTAPLKPGEAGDYER